MSAESRLYQVEGLLRRLRRWVELPGVELPPNANSEEWEELAEIDRGLVALGLEESSE